MTSLTTAGEITDFTVADTSTITTIAFGHTFISGDTAATVTVSNVTAITSLDMSSLTKVKTVRLTGNTKLASVTPPSSTVLAEPVAPISVVLYSNALTGEYKRPLQVLRPRLTHKLLSNQLNLQVSKHLLKLMQLKLIGQLLEVFCYFRISDYHI